MTVNLCFNTTFEQDRNFTVSSAQLMHIQMYCILHASYPTLFHRIIIIIIIIIKYLFSLQLYISKRCDYRHQTVHVIYVVTCYIGLSRKCGLPVFIYNNGFSCIARSCWLNRYTAVQRPCQVALTIIAGVSRRYCGCDGEILRVFVVSSSSRSNSPYVIR